MKEDQERIPGDLEDFFDAFKGSPAPDLYRKRVARAAFLTLAGEMNEKSDESSPLFMRHRNQMENIPYRRFQMTAVIIAIAVALVGLMTGGVAYASDAAVPGDALYGVDTFIEDSRLDMTSSSETALELLLQFADERLAEAQALAASGDYEGLGVALDNYNALISRIQQYVASNGSLDPVTLQALIDGLSDDSVLNEIDDFSPDDLDDSFSGTRDQLEALLVLLYGDDDLLDDDLDDDLMDDIDDDLNDDSDDDLYDDSDDDMDDDSDDDLYDDSDDDMDDDSDDDVDDDVDDDDDDSDDDD